MQERRNDDRKCTSDYYLVHETESGKLIGRVMDMNLDGTMMISETPTDVPDRFSCKMILPKMIGRHKHLHFQAESVWCRKNARLGWYETGYKITDLSDTDRKIIMELIEEWAVKKTEMPAAYANRA